MPVKGGKSYTGEYGCTIVPSLIIGSDGKRDKGFVTKFFYTQEAYNEEIANNNLVKRNVDRNGEFTNSVYNTNPIDRTRLTYTKQQADALGEDFENNASGCKDNNNLAKRSDFNTLPYLNYKNLGKSLDIFIDQDIPVDFNFSKQILSGLDDLLYNIIRMNKKGFFHNDIHQGNITIVEGGKAYLIDLGRFSNRSNSPTTKNLFDVDSFLKTVRTFLSHVISYDSQRKTIPKTNLEILSRFSSAGIQALLIEISNNVDDPASHVRVYDTVYAQFTSFVTSYTKVYGGKTKKTTHANRKTLRRRKVRRNVH